jgi:hypothetical protein
MLLQAPIGRLFQPIRGSWTPALTLATPGDLAVTYTGERVGEYIIHPGRIVEIRYGVGTSAWTHSTASGALHLTGLPFASVNESNYVVDAPVSWEGITKAGYTDIDANLAANASLLTFVASGSALGLSTVQASAGGGGDVPSGTNILFRGTMRYRY